MSKKMPVSFRKDTEIPGVFLFSGRERGAKKGPYFSHFFGQFYDDDFFQVTSLAPISGGSATSDLPRWLQDQLATVRSSFYKLQKARAEKLHGFCSALPLHCGDRNHMGV